MDYGMGGGMGGGAPMGGMGGPPQQMGGGPRPRTGFSVYVGNIPYNATEQDIGQLFSQCGQVTNVRFVFDRETGRMKGFGFCEFADESSAQNSINSMNGMDMNGRALRVNWANK